MPVASWRARVRHNGRSCLRIMRPVVNAPATTSGVVIIPIRSQGTSIRCQPGFIAVPHIFSLDGAKPCGVVRKQVRGSPAHRRFLGRVCPSEACRGAE